MDDSDRLSALQKALAERLGTQRYELWLGPHTSLAYDDGKLTIGCPSKFECQWLRSRLQSTLLESCQQIWGDGVSVHFKVCRKRRKTKQQSQPDSPQQPLFPELGTDQREQTSPPSRPRRQPRRRPGLKSSFANFVVGPSNELAHRLAQSVAEQPGHYGPLLLFGPPGVGKTHLCYAMLQQLRQSEARLHAIRITAEQFTGEFLAALDRRALPSFRQKYRSVDVLLIDDIQFLIGKRATIDELLHTIDTLHDRGRQVVLTCDRSPGDLQKTSVELVSRVSGGLSIPMEVPEFQTRHGIVRQLATRLKVSLDEPVIELIAAQVAGSARQLAGAINRLVATSMAHKSAITVDMARATLAEFVQQNTPSVRLADIQKAVCEVFGVEASSLKSQRKTRSITEPRMLAMWLARKYTRAALGEIGEYFGRRSHSTVVSAQKKIEKLVSENAEISVADRPCQVDEAIRQVESVLRSA
ncbi:MAG: chromosomal replication initiator protein DnaA [Planctomycetota bacterium]